MMFLEGLVWCLLGFIIGLIASVLIYAYADYKTDKDIEKLRKK
jgi:uncharacterized membrane protein